MGDCLLSNFDLAKLHFDQSNVIRNFKIIHAGNFSLCCVQYPTGTVASIFPR